MFYVSPLLTCKLILLIAQHDVPSVGTFPVHVLSVTYISINYYELLFPEFHRLTKSRDTFSTVRVKSCVCQHL